MNTDIFQLYERYPTLISCRNEIERLIAAVLACVRSGGKLLLCGNGGSEADCDHIAGELLKGFLSLRPLPQEDCEKLMQAYGADGASYARHLQCGIPAIPLPSLRAAATAYENDCEPSLVYAQLTYAIGRQGDMLWGISTSGNSANVAAALRVAHAMGLFTVALTGQHDSICAQVADITVQVPAADTYAVQELHLPVYHYVCACVERELYREKSFELRTIVE